MQTSVHGKTEEAVAEAEEAEVVVEDDTVVVAEVAMEENRLQK